MAERMREMWTSIERSKDLELAFCSASMIAVARHHAAGMLGQNEQQRRTDTPVSSHSAPSSRAARAPMSISSRPKRSALGWAAHGRAARIARNRASISRGSNGFGR